ncbi:CLUMA_CG012428, isoform A [Clunio marinus]|uniref:CLUMA_CG012428, isoform A n=1 Tax=Clunio marinus TaxID=568069 RepID=A0A1J1IF79_9DIPT|nr:CLUMA_CG012428, isoform A [Clunio marinus]
MKNVQPSENLGKAKEKKKALMSSIKFIAFLITSTERREKNFPLDWTAVFTKHTHFDISMRIKGHEIINEIAQ